MQYTTHYNLNLPEGSDVVNPLVQDNPNYTAIDAAMFANKQAVIGTASEVTSGTAHAITRSNIDSDYFRYTATSNWTTGDTMTVDGTAVSVYLSDGTAPLTGSYVINSEVLAFLSGTRVTLIISKSGAPASAISYNNTVSGLTAVNVQDAIDELHSDIHKGSVSVTADGVKKIKEIFNELFSLIDMAKISSMSYMATSNTNYAFRYTNRSAAAVIFSVLEPATNGYSSTFFIVESNESNCDFVSYTTSTSGTTSKVSDADSVPPSGRIFTIYY